MSSRRFRGLSARKITRRTELLRGFYVKSHVTRPTKFDVLMHDPQSDEDRAQ